MMKCKSVLKLNMASAMRKLADWKLDYRQNEYINLRLTDEETLGDGIHDIMKIWTLLTCMSAFIRCLHHFLNDTNR